MAPQGHAETGMTDQAETGTQTEASGYDQDGYDDGQYDDRYDEGDSGSSFDPNSGGNEEEYVEPAPELGSLHTDYVLPGVPSEEQNPYRWHTGEKRDHGGEDAIEVIDLVKQFGRMRILNGLNVGLPDDQISMVL